MKIAIDKIRVAARVRRDVGTVDLLAANIREHGLIAPIAVMRMGGGEFQLLAGLRRLRAMELNGETEIDAKVFPSSDAEAALKIEFSENEQREPFTFSEKMDYARLIEEIEKTKAKERMAEGGVEAGRGRPKPEEKGVNQGAYPIRGRSREAIGAKIGISGMQYDRAKYIAENAPPEVIEALDRGERTIRGTYDELRAKEDAARRKAQNTSPCPATGPTTPFIPAREAPKRSLSAKTDPYMEKLREQEAEAIRKRQDFDALSPEGKIEALRCQLKEARARAADAESKLAREKELRQNEMYHYNATIEMLQNQLAAVMAHKEV